MQQHELIRRFIRRSSDMSVADTGGFRELRRMLWLTHYY